VIIWFIVVGLWMSGCAASHIRRDEPVLAALATICAFINFLAASMQ